MGRGSRLIVVGFKEVYGPLTGTLHVYAGGELIFHGKLTGGMVIEEGGEAVVHGEIGRDVINHGDLTLHGRILGRLHGNPPLNTITDTQIVGRILPFSLNFH